MKYEEIKKIHKRVKELKRLKNNKKIEKFITKDEIESIIQDYESLIEILYTQEGHT